MKVAIRKVLGDSVVHFEGEAQDLFDALYQIPDIPDIDACPECKSKKIALEAQKTKGGHTFVKIVCKKCRLSVTLGQRREDKRYYARRSDAGGLAWERYGAGSPADSPSSGTSSSGGGRGNEDDLPF